MLDLADVFRQLGDKFEWMLLTSLLSYGTTTHDLVSCWVNLSLDASDFSFVIWHQVLTLANIFRQLGDKFESENRRVV